MEGLTLLRQKALDILTMEANLGQLDKELVRLFIDRRVFEKTNKE